MRRLKHIQQKDDVESYVKEFTMIVSPLLKAESEEYLLAAFIDGLKDDIRNEINRIEDYNLYSREVSNKRSLDYYINMAKDIERKNNKANVEYCSYCRRSGHNNLDCWSKDKKMKKKN